MKLAPLLIGAFGVQGGLLITGVITARALGVEGRGTTAAAMLVPSLAAFLGSLALGNLITVLVVSGQRAGFTLRVAFRSCALSASLATAASAAVAYFLLRDAVLAALAASAVPLLCANILVVGALNGLRTYWLSALAQMASPASYAIALLVQLIVAPLTPRWVMAWWVVSLVVAAAVSSVAVKRRGRAHDEDGSSQPPHLSARDMARRGRRSLLATYSPLESFRLDQVVAVVLTGTTGLGLYATALALSNLSKLVGQALSVQAVGSARHADGPVIRVFVRSSAVALGAGIVSAVALPPLIPFVFGSDFAGARPVAVLCCLAGGLMAGRKILTEGLRACEREGRASLYELWAVGVFVLAAFPLAIWQGPTGLASGLLLATACSFLLMFREIRRSGLSLREDSDEREC